MYLQQRNKVIRIMKPLNFRNCISICDDLVSYVKYTIMTDRKIGVLFLLAKLFKLPR